MGDYIDPLDVSRENDNVQFMMKWFRKNFENPVENCPYISAEGGFQYLKGGPFDGREVVEEQFYDQMPSVDIERVVKILEEVSYQWEAVEGGLFCGDLSR